MNHTFIFFTRRHKFGPKGLFALTRRNVNLNYVWIESLLLLSLHRYESKGKQWVSSKPKLPPGVYEEPAPAVDETKQQLSKSAKKNEKRKQKRKGKQTEDSSTNTPLNENGEVDGLAVQVQQVSIAGEGNAPGGGDSQKRLKNVKKKLRQIEELEAKIASGELAAPSKEQLEKMARKEALEEELRTLEEGS